MSGVREIASKIGQLDENRLANFCIEAIDEDDLNIVKDRMEQGLAADGSSFPPYTDLTLEMKAATGGFISPSGNIAWKDEGDFYDSWTIKKLDGFAEINSNDVNAEKIFEREPNVLDVSEEESGEMFELKRNQIIESIENFIFE